MSEVKLTLENFRNEMDEKALERGWFYFSKGWVSAPKEIHPEFYENIVTEVVPHAISYSIDEDDHVDDVFCTCGGVASRHSDSLKERTDANSPWCRHLAAVLFQIEDERRKLVPPNEHIID